MLPVCQVLREQVEGWKKLRGRTGVACLSGSTGEQGDPGIQ